MDNSKNIAFAKSQLELAENGHLDTFTAHGGRVEMASLYIAGFNDSVNRWSDNSVFVNKSDADEYCEDKVIFVEEFQCRKEQAINALKHCLKIEENRGKYW